MRRPGIVAPPGTPSDINLMYQWRPGVVSCYYNYLTPNQVFQYRAQNPGAGFVVLFPHPQNWAADPEASAVQFGRQIAARWSKISALNPDVIFANELNLYYENGDTNANNQPQYETEAFYRKIGGWVTRTAQVIKDHAPDMRLLCPPFAVGRHEDGAPDTTGQISQAFAGYDFLADALKTYFDNRFAFHAYWGDMTGSKPNRLRDPETASWHAFRWRRVLAMFQARYGINAQVMISQAGNFATYDADFFDQITYFSQNTLNDPRVLGLTYFLWEDPTFSPGNIFNVWSQYILNLPAFVQKLAAQPDVVVTTQPATPTPTPTIPTPPTPQPTPVSPPTTPPTGSDTGIPVDSRFDGPTIRVLFKDQRVRQMPIETYLRGVVPAEMPAEWPLAAVKAQAVAARTYAANKMHRAAVKEAAYDVTTDHNFHQVFNPEFLHQRSDQAILETKGVILTYKEGTQPIDAVYSSNCGGQTKNSETVWTTSPAIPYLRGKYCPHPGPKFGHGVGMCQDGAKLLAEQGWTYDQILRYYYTEVSLKYWQYTPDVVAAPPEIPSLPATPGTPTPVIPPTPANPPSGGGSPSLPVTPPTGGVPKWRMSIERRPGFSIIVGNLADEPGLDITVATPRNARFTVRSGAKPEFGKGGFEILLHDGPGNYTLAFDGETFTVPVDGQSTILVNFKPGSEPAPPPAQSTISGVLTDHNRRPVSGRTIQLSGIAGNRQLATDSGGRFFFENLAAGTYNLSVPGSPLSQTVILNGLQSQTVNLQLAATPTSGGWTVETETLPGNLPLIIGDIGVPNQSITITAPNGTFVTVTSGSKPEYGPGGFEAYAQEIGTYTISFSDKQFMIPMNRQLTRLIFKKADETTPPPIDIPVAPQPTPTPEPTARLVSAAIPRSKAEAWLAQLKAATAIGDFFQLEDLP